MADDEVPVKRYVIYLCDLCVGGAGGECHSPGCALWLKRAPDLALETEYMCVLVDEAEPAPAAPGEVKT